MLVLTSLAVVGGDMIYGFAIALLVGVTVGTYLDLRCIDILISARCHQRGCRDSRARG